MASLLSGTLWHTLTFPVTYLLLFILVITAVLQIRYLNRALQRFDSTQVIPTQFVLFTLSAIIGSAVLYRDFEKAKAEQFAKFIGGCFLTFLGVYLITSGRAKSSDSSDDRDVDDEVEAISLIDEERGEHIQQNSDGERDESRRKSRPSFTHDKSLVAEDSSRRQSKGQHSPPHTPHRFDSFSSSTMSRALADASEGEQSPLGVNPWRSSSEDVFSTADLRPAPLETTESTPLLPSEAQHLDPQSPNHPFPGLQPHDGASVNKRKSMARIMPGPLISPLSSPLHAIVADSLRRHGDTSIGRRRLRPSALRPSQSYQPPTSPDQTGERSRDASDDEPGGRREGRRQSMAAAFRDIFQPKHDRGQKDSRSDDGGS